MRNVMFRIEVYGLWSKDFMPSLARALADFLQVEPEEARAQLEQIGEKGSLSWESSSMKETLLLTEALMEFGAYVSVDQVGPLSEEQYQAEIIDDLSDDLAGWVVVLDKTEQHVKKIIDPEYLAKIRFGNVRMNDGVGEAMMFRGAAPVSKTVEEDLEARMKSWRTAWGQRIRAAIARKIALKKKQEEEDSQS